MRRALVSVATTPRFHRGQVRLAMTAKAHAGPHEEYFWHRQPSCWPLHSAKPFAFKAWAMQYAAEHGAETLLWCDSSIIAIRPLEPLWERIEQDGYWFSRNGWSNAEWCADSAYPELFPGVPLEEARSINVGIEHVVATCFGISMRHPMGRVFLEQYMKLANGRAFCGPWTNSNHPDAAALPIDGYKVGPCGPPTTRGSRHDQTVASVLAWSLGFKLTDPPEPFSYKGGEKKGTLVVADGSYV